MAKHAQLIPPPCMYANQSISGLKKHLLFFSLQLPLSGECGSLTEMLESSQIQVRDNSKEVVPGSLTSR